jgi:hypothetical protein
VNAGRPSDGGVTCGLAAGSGVYLKFGRSREVGREGLRACGSGIAGRILPRTQIRIECRVIKHGRH